MLQHFDVIVIGSRFAGQRDAVLAAKLRVKSPEEISEWPAQSAQ
jgi:hypothetical protein